ncbi:MAG: FAD-dependent oxidoreductase [Actinomycetota bacterium]
MMRVVVLGAGFGGLELSARLTAAVGDEVDITLIDKEAAFVFGFSKLDMMFGEKTPDAIRIPYRTLEKPGVRFRQETIRSIDPIERRVVTDGGTYDADVLVVALGADVDPSATPGLVDTGYEFYSVAGAERVRQILPTFDSGAAIVGVCGPSFKCPPAPSEAAILLDDYLRARGVRDATSVTLVMPFGAPVPPSPDTSEALLARFAERDITFVGQHTIANLDPARSVAVLDDGTELRCDLLLAIPVHHVPAVVESSGLAVDGWIPVDRATLATRFPDVYAIGDVTSVGTAKAGVFAEGAARVVADHLIAQIRGSDEPDPYDGAATCYIEFGDDLVGRVDVDFFSGPSVTGVFTDPSEVVAAEKFDFAADRRARWFQG